MSFILDALRKSEHERQRQTGPGIADLRPTAARSPFPAWAIALAALLLVNIAVVAWLLLRSDPVQGTPASTPGGEARTPPAPAAATVAATVAADQAPATEAATSGSHQGVSASVFSTDGLNPPAQPVAPGAVAGDELQAGEELAGDDPELVESIPTADELVGRGVVLPPLHVDLHVYVARPAGRFVFINQRRYREGARLPEGPIVDRITRDGVIMSYGGNQFRVPRPSS